MTNRLHRLVQAHEALSDELPLPPLEVCGVHVQSQEIAHLQPLLEVLDRFKPRIGSWLSRQRVGWLDPGQAPPTFDAEDPLFDAEFIGEEGEHLIVRHLGMGWRVVTIRHLPQGTDFLCDLVQRLGRPPAPEQLFYRRYWRLEPRGGALPFLAVLIGADI